MFCYRTARKKSTVVPPELSSLVRDDTFVEMGYGETTGRYAQNNEDSCHMQELHSERIKRNLLKGDLSDAKSERRSQIPDVQPVFRAVETQSLNSLSSLLKRRPELANCHGGAFHMTPLHTAVESNWSEGVAELLEHGASVTSRNQYGQTPFHYAAAKKRHTVLGILLDRSTKANIDIQDLRGVTGLHDAASVGCLKSVQQFLKHGASPSVLDTYGQTPLHKATKAGELACAAALMKAGADVLQKDDRGVTPKRYLRENPENMETLFDLGIQMSTNRQSGFPLTFDFSILVAPYKIQQCTLLNNFAKSDCNYLLAHPLCHIFLLVKWRRARFVFIGYLLFFTIFTTLTYVKMLDRFVWSVRERNRTQTEEMEYFSQQKVKGFPDSEEEEEKLTEHHLNISRENVLILHIIMIIQMLFFAIGQISRLRNFTMTCLKSVTWWLLCLIIVLCIVNIAQSYITPDEPQEWERHLATIIVMLQGTQILHLLSKFPSLGIYWLMYVRVAEMFLRVFFIYLCLLVTFTMTFYLALASGGSEGTFDSAGFTFLKSLTMMIGELDLEEMKPDLAILPVTSHILMVCFILLVSIILANLLVALAVSDINELRAIAHLMRLASMVEAIVSIEQLWDCPILKYLAQLCYLPTDDLQFRLWPRTDQRHTKIIVKLNENASKLPLSRVTSKTGQSWFMYFAKKLRSSQYSVRISSCILENILDRLDVKEGHLDSRLSVKFRCLGRSGGGRKVSAAEMVSRRRHTLCKPGALQRSTVARRVKLASQYKKKKF